MLQRSRSKADAVKDLDRLLDVMVAGNAGVAHCESCRGYHLVIGGNPDFRVGDGQDYSRGTDGTWIPKGPAAPRQPGPAGER